MPKETTYKNKPILILDPEVKEPYFPFSFGLSNARVIIDSINRIEDYLINKKDDKKRPTLDITPEINISGKKFIVNKYRARLIFRHFSIIRQFVSKHERNYEAGKMQENEGIRRIKSHYPAGVRDPWEKGRKF